MDLARFTLILYIVTIIHPMYWSGTTPSQWQSFLLLEMPPIFIITGAAFAASNRYSKYSSYIFQRLQRVLIPYWIYCIFAIAISILISKTLRTPLPEDVAKITLAMLNPFARHRKLLEHPLAAHLWFVPIYLIVVALMPLLARWFRTFATVSNSAMYWFFAGVTLFCLVDVYVPIEGPVSFTRHVIAYGFWAAFGYTNATKITELTSQRMALVASGVALLVCHLNFGYSLDMQTNKFPPNQIFFCFSFSWVMILLIVIRTFQYTINRFSDLIFESSYAAILSKSYSLYLWHPIAFLVSTWTIGYLFGNTRSESPALFTAALGICTLGLALVLTKILGQLENIAIKPTKTHSRP